MGFCNNYTTSIERILISYISLFLHIHLYIQRQILNTLIKTLEGTKNKHTQSDILQNTIKGPICKKGRILSLGTGLQNLLFLQIRPLEVL